MSIPEQLLGRTAYFVLAIVVMHILILNNITFFPYPELFIYPYLKNIGLVPYKEILDQHFPGLMFFPINLGNLGITTPGKARALSLILVSFEHILIYLTAFKLTKSKAFSLVANLLFLLWHPFFEGYVLWIDSFIFLFTIPAFYLLLDEKLTRKSVYLAGLFIGFGLLMKQVLLPLIILVLLYLIFWKKSFKLTAYYLSGFGIPALILFLYVLSQGIFVDFYFWTVEFNLTTFSKMGRKFASTGELVKAGALFLPAMVVLWASLRKKVESYNLLVLIFLLSLGMFAYARFDFIHLQPALPFAIFSIIVFASRNKLVSLLLAPALLLVSVVLLFRFYVFHWGGETLFFGEFEHELVNITSNYVEPGDAVFAMGTTPHFYYLTGTRPPGNVFVFPFPWFMVEAEERILNGIVADPPELIVRDLTASTGGQNLALFMPAINKHIEQNYKIVSKIDTTEVLIKK